MIKELKINEIFVFGSNLFGVHGAGAARQAFDQFDAVWGKGEGLQGRSYALPTKYSPRESLSIDDIKHYVHRFFECCNKNKDLVFLLTPVGCGYAGYDIEEMAPLFKKAPSNVVLPPQFMKFLNK